MTIFFAFFCGFVGFFVGFGASFGYNWHVKRTALSITRANAGEKGREAKTKQEGELMALIADATLAFKTAKEQGENFKVTAARVVPALIAKYPTTCLKHSKKLLKMATDGGGLEGLEEFF